MRLSLLTPPTESPRSVPTVPIPKNWATERDIAVDTRALPRSLNLAAMDPGASSAPMAALARLGAAGAEVSTQIFSTVMHAQALKQEAEDVGTATLLYTQTAESIDTELERLKTSTDYQTLRPAFDELWKQTAGEALAKAPNPAVKQTLGLKLAGFRLTKSSEVSNAETGKFRDFQKATFEAGMDGAAKRATEATSQFDRDYNLSDLESLSRAYAKGGALPLEYIKEYREKKLEGIATDRAYNDAFLEPLGMLQRLARGEELGLDTKKTRSLAEYAENRIRTLRADQENVDAKRAKVVKAEQDDRAIGWRQKISANYGAEGPGMDLTGALSDEARTLGKENYAQLETMHRAYREHFLKPETAKVKSDPEYVGRAQYAIITGRLGEVSQKDLLQWFQTQKLDEGDYTRLSGLLDQQVKHQQAEAKKGQPDANDIRKEQIKDAEKAIDDYLSRGSRYQGDPKSKASDILIRDGITELHTRVNADPTLDPGVVADEMIARRIAQAQSIAKTLPYKNKAEVIAAYQAKRIDKRTSDRYMRIMDALEKAGAEGGTEAAMVPPPAPGVWQRLFGGQSTPTPDTRKPVTP